MAEEESERVLVLSLHSARKKARRAAEAEVVALLDDWGAHALPGGPRAEVSGTAWVGVKPTVTAEELSARLRYLGYSSSVQLAEPAAEHVRSEPGRITWKGRHHVLRPLYQESQQDIQSEAPDRRSFLLECGDGEVRRVVGYRGGPGPLEHRALPVYDARLLVNLLGGSQGGVMLDPFAGAGSIVLFARRAGWNAVALDIDRSLRFGLAEIAGRSVVADASDLPFGDRTVEAVASEPPYEPGAWPSVRRSVFETARVLKPGCPFVLFVADAQADSLRRAGQEAGFEVDLDVSIDRKGLPVRCLRMRSGWG
jgi:hypothetical protein